MSKILIAFLNVYKKFISPTLTRMFGSACRFTPTCGEYTIEALEKYGTVKGLSLGAKRIAKCHPFGGSGYDPLK